jgi:hypothetical protein
MLPRRLNCYVDIIRCYSFVVKCNYQQNLPIIAICDNGDDWGRECDVTPPGNKGEPHAKCRLILISPLQTVVHTCRRHFSPSIIYKLSMRIYPSLPQFNFHPTKNSGLPRYRERKLICNAIRLYASQVPVKGVMTTDVQQNNCHNSGHYPSSCLLFKTQLNSIGLSVPHRNHITSPLRPQQVNAVYRKVKI